jgi:hypothetical protein
MNSAIKSVNLISSVEPLEKPFAPNGVELFKLSIYFQGVKKRCRKSDRHLMTISHFPYNNGQYDKEAIIALVHSFIETNVTRTDSMVNVTLDYIVKSEERGFTVTQWEPFSDRHVKFQIAANK